MRQRSVAKLNVFTSILKLDLNDVFGLLRDAEPRVVRGTKVALAQDFLMRLPEVLSRIWKTKRLSEKRKNRNWPLDTVVGN